MPTLRVRTLLFLSFLVGCTAGCQGIPPAPAAPGEALQQRRSQSSSEEDPYEGWLFRKLTGQEEPSDAQAGQVGRPSRPDTPGTPGTPVVADPNPVYSRAESLPGTPLTDSSGADLQEDGPRTKPRNGLEVEDFYLENIVKNIKAAAGYGPDRKIAKTALEKGESLFREEKYEEAAKELKIAADRWPESTIEEDALFLLGECQFFTDLYFKAHDSYGKLLKNHSNTRYLDTVMHRTFAIARYWDQQQKKSGTWPITPNLTDATRPRFDTFGHAVEAYQRIRLHDPTGPLADHALMAMANGYFVRNQFENAAWNYDLLRREYPNSSYQLEAHLLGLQAKKRIYQGSYYDGKPLEEAEEIVQQALTLFPGELDEAERERLVRNRAQIVEEQALREFEMAQFYEMKRWYGASRFYYHRVIDEFPESQTAA
ncbi:MAG: tetratricopeptide repeat protein, partial [Thermoguttaceae bacterium]|nr:tetratricopeptide repeat protein [Thermoguttaceae bacterium]